MNILKIGRLSGLIVALGVFGLLAGCGNGLSGKYTDSSGNLSLSFRSGGKVLYEAHATGRSELDTYAISKSRLGKKVTIRSKGGTVGILYLRPDGCLLGPTMGALCRPGTSR